MAMDCYKCPEGSSWELCNRTSRPVPCPWVSQPRCVKVEVKRTWKENTSAISEVFKTNTTYMKPGCVTHSQCVAKQFEPCIQDNTSRVKITCLRRMCCFGNLCNQATNLSLQARLLLAAGVVSLLTTTAMML